MLGGRPLAESGKKIRLNRVLGGTGHRALVVAFDHALVLGPIPGTRDPLRQIERFVRAKADSILLNLGLIRQLASLDLDARLPGIIARIDWTTIWSSNAHKGGNELRTAQLATPEEALRHGSDAVLTYMAVGTGDTDFESKEIARTAEVARECERVGIPFIVESLARGKDVENPGDPKWLNLHTRMATELGADAVKTDYSGDPDSMRAIVEECPLPILVLGGNRHASDEGAMNLVREVALAGAAGVFFGRNVFQSPDIGSFLQKARSMLDGV
jgi:DhnA family fructose-bisphosphate aldolase class Ia